MVQWRNVVNMVMNFRVLLHWEEAGGGGIYLTSCEIMNFSSKTQVYGANSLFQTHKRFS